MWTRRSCSRWLATSLPVLLSGCNSILGLGGLAFDRDACASSGGRCASGSAAGELGSGGLAGAGSSDGGAECAQHADCIERYQEEPYVCRNGQCIPLTNQGDNDGACKFVLGERSLRDGREVFLFGAFSNLSEPNSRGAPATLNYDLAVRELSTTQGGVMIGGRTQYPVAILCDAEDGNLDRLKQSLDHLIHTVGVAAVIAPLAPTLLKSAFEYANVKQDGDVFFLSPLESDDLLTTLPDRDRLWTLLGSPADIAPAYLPLVTRVEDYLNPNPASGEPVRLALIDNLQTFQSALGSLLSNSLRFNGKTALENGPDYLRLRLTEVETNATPDFQLQLEAIRTFKPHIVVATGGKELLPFMFYLEQSWWNTAPGQPPPFYVLSPALRATLWRLSSTITQIESLPTRPNLLGRLVGINHAKAEDTGIYDQYLSALQATYPGATPGALVGTENFYDAVYYLVYAAVAASASGEDVSGSDLAKGMMRLTNGARYEVGALGIPLVGLALQSSPSITLYDALGPPTFDLKTGARRGNGSVWCLTKDGEDSSEFHDDTLRYDPGSAMLSGTFACFPDF